MDIEFGQREASETSAELDQLLQLIRDRLADVHLRGDQLPALADRMSALVPAESKSEWDELIGPFYTTRSLGVALAVTRQRLHQLRAGGRVLATPTGNGTLLYPVFQFGLEKRATPLPHLPQVTNVLAPAHMNAWSVALWLHTPRPELAAEEPSVWLRGGPVAVQSVLDLAREDVRRRIAA